MKSTTHRVVILNKVESDLISQAILILKNSEEVLDSSVIIEAEKIVEKYMSKRRIIKHRKSSLLYALGLFVFGFLCSLVTVFIIR